MNLIRGRPGLFFRRGIPHAAGLNPARGGTARLDSPARAPYPALMTDYDGRRWHDMGGLDAGPVEGKEHDYSLWEKRVDALMVLCSSKGHFSVDGLRRALEDMGEEAFEKLSYYERWIEAVNRNLIEAGVYTTAELGEKMEQVKARGGTYGEAARG